MSGLQSGTFRCPPGGLLAFGLAWLLAGCAAAPPAAVAPPAAAVSPAAPPTRKPDLVAALGPEDVAARILELETKLKKGGNADPGGVLSRELAMLYSHPANRSPDPGKALALLRTYLSRAVPAGKDPEAERLVALLEGVDRLGRLLRESTAREKELSGQAQEHEQRELEMKKREQDLLAEIRALRERIDKLKALDLEMEKRRKSVR